MSSSSPEWMASQSAGSGGSAGSDSSAGGAASVSALVEAHAAHAQAVRLLYRKLAASEARATEAEARARAAETAATRLESTVLRGALAAEAAREAWAREEELLRLRLGVGMGS